MRERARATGRTMFRVNYVHNKGQAASLELLGSPQMLGVAESLCGRNFVPTYESLVFKQEGDGAAIVWHQDAVHPRHYRIFDFDLYLDRSTADGGALHVIPDSQFKIQDICAIEHEWGWNPPGVEIIEMEPGDVLLHDDMVVHGSKPVEGKSLRRTIYYEFRAAEEILPLAPFTRGTAPGDSVPAAHTLYIRSNLAPEASPRRGFSKPVPGVPTRSRAQAGCRL